MITPITVDVNVPELSALIAVAELFDHPQTGGILGSNVDLDSMQPDLVEQIVRNQCHRGRRHTSARHIWRHPIADAR